jgi:pimeloyl-ACP methyl ester carboxylesterase
MPTYRRGGPGDVALYNPSFPSLLPRIAILDREYRPLRAARSTFLTVNRLNYHVREWGDPSDPLLVMVHGWMDVSASFQFLVDDLAGRWHVVAPDWRGYGLSAWTGASSYWAADYLADLDQILAHYSPDEPVRLIGHSMGGNAACVYAGVRPARIRTLVNLEGLGLPGDEPGAAPARMRAWLDALADPPSLKDYESFEAVAKRLQKTNPRLNDARAAFLAPHWSAKAADGRFQLRADPAHKIPNPATYRASEVIAIWQQITAPVLWVMARDSDYAKKMEGVPDYADRLAKIARIERVWIDDTAHMLHHDRSQELALVIEAFLERHGAGPSQ